MLSLQMLRVTLSLVAGVALLGVVSCVKCPDGKRICPDKQTCCRATTGYNCCPYPDVSGVGTCGNVGLVNLCKLALTCLLSSFRLCAALTCSTAAPQGTLATLPPRCVRNTTCRGLTSPWWWKRRRNQAPLFSPRLPHESLRTTTSRLKRRAWTSIVTTSTTVPTAPPVARFQVEPGPAVFILLWVRLHHHWLWRIL